VINSVPTSWQQQFADGLYSDVLVPCCAEREGAVPVPPAHTARGAARRAKEAEILSRPPPKPSTDPGMWASVLQEEVDRLRESWKDPVGAAEAAAPGGGGVGDKFLEIRNALAKEVESFAGMLKAEQAKRFRDSAYAPHGWPLQEGPASRYEFWCAQADKPLLTLCAQMLLAGSGICTVENERLHSPATFLTAGRRASTLPDKVEQLTLAHVMSRSNAAEAQAGKALLALERQEEERQLLEEQQAALEEIAAMEREGAPEVVE